MGCKACVKAHAPHVFPELESAGLANLEGYEPMVLVYIYIKMRSMDKGGHVSCLLI